MNDSQFRHLLHELATHGELKGDVTTLQDFTVITRLRVAEEGQAVALESRAGLNSNPASSPAPSHSETPSRRFLVGNEASSLIAPFRNPQRFFAVHPCVNPAVEVRYRCPCCGYRTLEAPGTLQLCPVCWWEDDGQEDDDAAEVRLTVNAQLSLKEARQHFTECGAAHPRFLTYVRKPQPAEQ